MSALDEQFLFFCLSAHPINADRIKEELFEKRNDGHRLKPQLSIITCRLKEKRRTACDDS